MRLVLTIVVVLTWFSPESSIAQLPESHHIRSSDSIVILNELFDKYSYSDPKLAFKYALKLNSLSKRLENKESEAESLNLMGIAKKRSFEYSESHQYFRQAKDYFLSLGDREGAGIMAIEIGILYFDFKLYSLAMENYLDAEQLLKDSPRYPRALYNIGSVYSSLGQYTKALESYNNVLKLSPNDITAKHMCLNNIGALYFRMEDYPTALKYYKENVKLKESLALKNQLASAYNRIGDVYYKLNSMDSAYSYLEKADSLATEMKQDDKLVQIFVSKSEFFRLNKRYNEALESILMAENILVKANIPHLKGVVYSELARVYEAVNELEKSINYESRAYKFNDSIKITEERQTIELLTKIEDDKKNKTSWWTNPYLIIVPSLLLIYISLKLFKREKRLEPTTKTYSIADEKLSAILLKRDGKIYMPASRRGEELYLDLEKIIWFEKNERYSIAISIEGRFSIRYNLTQLESILPKNIFFRINRVNILNINFVQNYSFWENDKYIVRIKNDDKTQFTMSRDRLKSFNEWFKPEQR